MPCTTCKSSKYRCKHTYTHEHRTKAVHRGKHPAIGWKIYGQGGACVAQAKHTGTSSQCFASSTQFALVRHVGRGHQAGWPRHTWLVHCTASGPAGLQQQTTNMLLLPRTPMHIAAGVSPAQSNTICTQYMKQPCAIQQYISVAIAQTPNCQPCTAVE